MKLSLSEYKAMQMGWRKWMIRDYELKTFQEFEFIAEGKNILEAGCGNGYAAGLITAMHPAGYWGIDIMPEQIALAEKRALKNAQFIVGDVSDLSMFQDSSMDAVLDFCILHHVEDRIRFFQECRRVLKDDGGIFIADLSEKMICFADRCFRWDHNKKILFTFPQLETEAAHAGFYVSAKMDFLGLECIWRFRKIPVMRAVKTSEASV